MKRLIITLAFSALITAGCGDQASDQKPASASPPASAGQADPAMGKALFIAKCARCHGQEALGTKSGPPLIHKIYEPGHHADFSFQRAVSSGVRSHHWGFGDMPPIPGVSTEQTGHIIAYIRQQQRLVGIE